MSTPDQPTAPPAFSTPDARILESASESITPSTRTDAENLAQIYEIQRTVSEIQRNGWRRVALQFPDDMLGDAPRVCYALGQGLAKSAQDDQRRQTLPKLFILADTSYSSCCVDEVAAEHASADAIIHYGRACLSPTARLPALHVFTLAPLDIPRCVTAFDDVYREQGHDAKVILSAELPYTAHLAGLHAMLVEKGYSRVHLAEVQHNPSSPIPNRTVPNSPEDLKTWHLFHISSPPPSLLLTLSSRLSTITILPLPSYTPTPSTSTIPLRRRYAQLTRLSSITTWGILINTLSVSNYLTILAHIKEILTSASRSYYTVVVGKLNPAKLANFADIQGFVVIGCPESSLVESKDFWRPVVTPFELELALQDDAERVWTGAWSADFADLLGPHKTSVSHEVSQDLEEEEENEEAGSDSSSDAPPEFDLRTGRLVERPRPQRPKKRGKRSIGAIAMGDGKSSNAVAKAVPLALTSSAASFMRTQRTWTGLGSDFTIEYDESGAPIANEGAALEIGRRGIARGYVVGDDREQR